MNDQNPQPRNPSSSSARPGRCTAALRSPTPGSRHPAGTLPATPPAAPGGTPGQRSRQGPGPDRRERGLPGPVPARQRTAPAGRQAPRHGRVQPRPAARPARLPAGQHVHQPDLEELLLARVDRHPLISLRRGAEVTGLDGAQDPLTADPVRVHARVAGEPQTFTGRVVLGCDGANSTIRQLAGITMDDLGFTERWLVVDIRSATAWTPGTASSRSATPPAPPPSCRSPATGTAGSSGCATARTKPA